MKIINVVGARPNFMKIAPLMRQFSAYPEIEALLVHTGQHYDENMSRVFFEELGIPRPDLNLDVGSGSHAVQTAEVMLRFEPVVLREKPDLVLVVGDVNSTIAAGLVAAKLHIPLAHVEAGVRSFDRRMPEEINRVLTDALADLLFTPSEDANANLAREGIAPEKVHFVGNIMADSLLAAAPRALERAAWQRWGLQPGEYALLTLHRPSNVDDPAILGGILDAVDEIAHRLPVLFPIHPRTAARLDQDGLGGRLRANPNVIFSEPLGYLDFLCLMARARLMLSDSGGVQSETSMLGVPCLTLRENTEWPVTLSEGTNHLVGTDPEQIQNTAQAVLDSPAAQPLRPRYWDGGTAGRVVTVIRQQFGNP